jgi:hypothetical protein
MPDEIDDFAPFVEAGWTPEGVAKRLRSKGVVDEDFIGRIQAKMQAASVRLQPQQTYTPDETGTGYLNAEGMKRTGTDLLSPIRAAGRGFMQTANAADMTVRALVNPLVEASEAMGVAPAGTWQSFKDAAQNQNRAVMDYTASPPDQGVIPSMVQGLLAAPASVVQNETAQRLTDAGVDITSAKNRSILGASGVANTALLAAPVGAVGIAGKVGAGITNPLARAATTAGILAGSGAALGGGGVATTKGIGELAQATAANDDEQRAYLGITPTWGDVGVGTGVGAVAPLLAGRSAFTAANAGGNKLAAQNAADAATIAARAPEFETPVNRGVDPIPDIRTEYGVKPGREVTPEMAADLADANRYIRENAGRQNDAPAVKDARVPEEKGGVGGEAEIVDRIKTPKPISVTPDENAIDVLLRNRERIAAADQRAADLGVNTEVNAATSAATRKVLGDLGLDDPRAPAGKIPEIRRSDVIDASQPDRTIVTSDPVGAAEGRRRADFDAMGRRREEQQAADAAAKPPEPENLADSRARAAENEDTMLSDDIERQVHEDAVKEIGPIGYGQSAENYMKRLQLRREEIKLRSGNAGMNFPKSESKPPKPPRTQQPKSDVGDPDNPPPISDDAKAEAARLLEGADEPAPPGSATVEPTPKTDAPVAEAPVVERPQETTPVVSRETPVDTPQPQKAGDAEKAVLKAKHEAIIAKKKAEQDALREKARLREEAVTKSQQEATATEVPAEVAAVEPTKPVVRGVDASRKGAVVADDMIPLDEPKRVKALVTSGRIDVEGIQDPAVKAKVQEILATPSAPRNVTRSGGTSMVSSIADYIADTWENSKISDNFKTYTAKLYASKRSAEERIADTLKRAKTDPTAVTNHVKQLSDTIVNEKLASPGTIAAALINGGHYRTLIRPLFVPELAAKQRAKIVSNPSIRTNAISWFERNGSARAVATEIVDDIIRGGADHQSPGSLTGPKKVAIEKLRNKNMPSELDELFGRLEKQSDTDAMTLHMMENLVETRRAQKNMVDDLVSRGDLRKAAGQTGWQSFDGTWYESDKPYLIKLLANANEVRNGILENISNHPITKTVDTIVRASTLFADPAKHAFNMAGSAVSYLTTGSAGVGSFLKAAKQLVPGRHKSMMASNPTYKYAYENGVIQTHGVNVGGSSKEVLGTGKWKVEKAVDSAAGVLAAPSTKGENAVRYATFLDNVEYLREAYPTWTQAKVMSEAATRTLDAFPTTEKAFGFIKDLPRMIRGFPTFAVEAGIRNPIVTVGHLAGDIMSPSTSKLTKAKAWGKIARVIGVGAVFPWLVERYSKSSNDITADEENQVRRQAGFNENAQIYFYRDEKGVANGVAFGRVIPFAYPYEIVRAISRPDYTDKVETGTKIAGSVTNPFVGGPMATIVKDTAKDGIESLPGNVKKATVDKFKVTNPIKPVVDKTAPDYGLYAASSYAKTSRKLDMKDFRASDGGTDAVRSLLKETESNDDRVIAAVKSSLATGKSDVVKVEGDLRSQGYKPWEIAHILKGERIPRDPDSFEIDQRANALREGSATLARLRDGGTTREDREKSINEIGRDKLRIMDRRNKLAGKISSALDELRKSGKPVPTDLKQRIIQKIDDELSRKD